MSWRRKLPRQVVEQELPGFRPDLIESGKQPQVYHFLPIGPIEAFDKGILIGFARLDEFDFGFVILSPVLQVAASKFGSVVNSNLLRESAFVFELFQDTDHSLARQRRVHLDSLDYS